jgi:hypothetical protein
VVEAARNADFVVDLRSAWLLEARQFEELLAKETWCDEALALHVRVVEQLERETRRLRVRVLPNRPSDGVYWVRYKPETVGTNILQVALDVDGLELPDSPILVRTRVMIL